jgi:hypothetical protein
MTDTDIYDKARVIADMWGTRCPDKTFFGMTRDDFLKIIAPSGEARKQLAQLDTQTRDTLGLRDKSDKILRRAVVRVINAVKGDPEQGEDSELLASMGYLPHTARTSILSAARKLRNAAKAAAAAGESEEEEPNS